MTDTNPAPAPVVDETAIQQRALNGVREILAVGEQFKQHGGVEIAGEAIRTGKDERWVRDQIMQRMAAGAQASPSAPDVGMSPAEIKRYSVGRALAALASGDWKGAGLEREAHEALLARGIKADHGGILVPYEVQKRDMSTAANGGGYLVETVNDAASFIDLLRNRTVVGELGATFLPGLKGNITIPKLTAAGTAYWLSNEATSATESNQTIGQLAMSPKTVGAYTEYSRQLMLQSSMDVEGMVQTDLATVLGLAIQQAAISGSGSSNQPSGILTQVTPSVVGGTDGAAPTWANLIELETDVAVANADVGTLGYLTNAKVRGKLKGTPKVSGQDTFIWEGGDFPVNGYQVGITNAVPSNLTKGSGNNLSAIIFGDFSSLIVGMWGSLDLMVDPYSNSTSGTVRVVALQDVDIALRHAESFATMVDAVTA